MERAQRHFGYEKHVQQMKIAEELLRRFSGDFHYINEWSIEDEEKKDKCLCPDETHGWRTLPSGCAQWIDEHCAFCKDKYAHWQQRRCDKFMSDWTYLWKLIEKDSRSWWD